MEEIEGNLLESSIGWLADTIVENLDNDKFGAWISQVGLADDTEKLRSEVERVEVVVGAVKGRAIANKPLARSLGRLREVLYDADDAVDELEYYRLQHQLQGDSCADEHGVEQAARPSCNAGIASSSGGKKRSKAWEDFDITEKENGKAVKARCIHCHTVVKCGSDKGTSVLHNHLKSDNCKKKREAIGPPPDPSSAGEGAPNAPGNSVGRKRMRMDGTSTLHEAVSTHPWNRGELSNMIQHMTHQLQEAVNGVMRLCGYASLNQRCESTPLAPNAITSSYPLEPKMYGRDAEMESIKNLIMGNKSNDITVLPIVGIGGIGKTTLSQHVYNDPEIGNQFEIKIWVHVSDKFDVVRITREILGCVSNRSYQGISNFNMLQQDLEKHMKSKKFLIVLDDVWDVTTEDCWNKLLGPLRPNHVNASEVTGNMIIVTTRILTVAQRCGTAGSINLEALEDGDIWSLFKAYAFSTDQHGSNQNLENLGRKTIKELKGNPLAAKTVGSLLRRNLTEDHWINIIENKEWQSLKHTDGIMHVLKFSYDYLPNQLQQSFSYCSLFPKGYSFSKAQLIKIWIAQGFVEKSSEKFEHKGWEYLTELVNSGFFQQAESWWSSSVVFVMHDLMHDLARLVSQTECATIDGSECRELAPSIRHLSIVTNSAYCKYQNGKLSRNEEFEKSLMKVMSRSKLRTLVLIGQYNHHFFKSFQDAFREAQHLRLLHITAAYADLDSFLSSLANTTHLRYLRFKNKESHGAFHLLLERVTHEALPHALSKCYHLQVLDIGSYGSPLIPDDINNLVSLRHLAQKGVCSSIASIGEMASLQKLTNFKVENSIGFEITQLQCMSEPVEPGVSRLENVTTQQEASGASLKSNHCLEGLHLFWKGVRNGYDSDGNRYDSGGSSENECDGNMISEPSMHSETEGERLQMSDSNGAPSLDHILDIASEELEGLEPHHNLKYLRISWYNGTKAPTWLSTSLTYLQTLRLENCAEWHTLSLEGLSLLRKLVLIEMKNASVLSIRSPQDIILIGMQNLHTCSCTSMVDFNSSLRILKIKRCPVLKVFPLFENCRNLGCSWLPHLSNLTIDDCPDFTVPHPFPPSTTVSEFFINGISTLPTMRSNEGIFYIRSNSFSDKLTAMDKTVLPYHNLSRFVTTLHISQCRNLRYISLEGLRQLIHLKRLKIDECQNLFSSDVPQEPTSTREDMVAGIGNRNDRPSLELVSITECGITGKWLSQILQHVQGVQELTLRNCLARIHRFSCRITPPSLTQEVGDLALYSHHKVARRGPPTISGRTRYQFMQQRANLPMQNATKQSEQKVNSHAPCHAAKWPTGKYETGDEKQRKLVKYPTSARACPMDLCAEILALVKEKRPSVTNAWMIKEVDWGPN
ncbi:putative disease resistance protein RGA4 [Oryza sativa Japonica Group]|uniref:putative disease resistance protein RGA4 n=1 Tax=Oryza sativa subsp. japonica TaxID=39947 RepID=UPI00339C965E